MTRRKHKRHKQSPASTAVPPAQPPVSPRSASMALMIPEIIITATAVEQEAFAQLRRCLPASCVVWYRTALELNDEALPPFLGMAEEAGIFAIYPFDYTVADTGQNGQLRPDVQTGFDTAISKHRALLDELRDSELPELVNAGQLKPATHRVALLMRVSGSDIHRLQLYRTLPDTLLLGHDQIGQLYDILKSRTRPDRQLSSEQFNAARLIISPSSEIKLPQRPTAIVAGNFRADDASSRARPLPLLVDVRQEQIIKSFAEIPPDQVGLTRDLDTRLVRGVVGSGKSLILLHRARFLQQLYPDWRILVVTYNRSLADFLHARYTDIASKTGGVEITDFHAWCYSLLNSQGLWPGQILEKKEPQGLLVNVARQQGISLDDTEAKYLVEEFDWIRDMGIRDLNTYATVERHGRKQRFGEAQRARAWKLLQAYREEMRKKDLADWSDIPLRVLEAMETGRIKSGQYHAVLIDEAQDFGAVWFTILQKALRPSSNLMFIVADGAQRIYGRAFSWKSLGIDVTGNRSRILTRSYRNTYQILRAAREVVKDDPAIIAELQSVGDTLIEPELDSYFMRRGPLPVLWSLTHPHEEACRIADEIHMLHNNGYAWGELGVFCRDNNSLDHLGRVLRSKDIPVQIARGRDIRMATDEVKVLTLHASKGLEFSVVFVAGADKLQPRPGLSADELASAIATERRLLYVGMTRARDRLYLTHTGSLPTWALQALSTLERQG